jgi:hypothetical protein
MLKIVHEEGFHAPIYMRRGGRGEVACTIIHDRGEGEGGRLHAPMNMRRVEGGRLHAPCNVHKGCICADEHEEKKDIGIVL